jgi:hypothetical protein
LVGRRPRGRPESPYFPRFEAELGEKREDSPPSAWLVRVTTPTNSGSSVGGRVGASTPRQGLMRWAVSGNVLVETVQDRTTRRRQTCAWDRMERRNLGCRLHCNLERLGPAWASEKAHRYDIIRPRIEMSRPKRRNGAAYLHRRRVLALADTRLSPMGVTWGSATLGPCSLRMGSQEPPVRHGPIVTRCPGNGPDTPPLEQKGGTGRAA